MEDTLMKLIRDFLKPVLVYVMTECLTEAFLAVEEKRRKRYYTREEVCERLRIGTTTFYRLVNKGKLRILKLEGKTLVDADELDRAVETKKVFRYMH